MTKFGGSVTRDGILPAYDTLTILQCVWNGPFSGVARKTLDATGEVIRDFQTGTRFFVQTVHVADLYDLYDVIDQMRQRPDLFLISGRLIADLDPSQAHPRNIKTFMEVPHNWVMLDCDELEAPPGLDPASDKAIEWLIQQRLPLEFHNVSYVCQFSSRAGTEAAGRKIKAHLFFWKRDAATPTMWREWAFNNLVDSSVFQHVHPLYTADPAFVSGSDPLEGRRLFLVEKDRPELDLTLQPARIGRTWGRPVPSGAPVLNPDGLIIDGREPVLRNCVFKAGVSLKLGADYEEVAEVAWDEFSRKCDLNDGKWTFDDALRKAQYLLKRAKDGHIGPRQLGEGESGEPHFKVSPKPISVIRPWTHNGVVGV